MAAFKVKDNRRFDSSGVEREDEEEGSKKAPAAVQAGEKLATNEQTKGGEQRVASTSAESKAQFTMKEPEPVAAQADSQVDFSSFIISLGTQALMQLGVIRPPDGMDMPVDKQAARQTIEIISMLEQKTKGNLDAGEEKLLVEVLHNVRMSFVKVV